MVGLADLLRDFLLLPFESIKDLRSRGGYVTPTRTLLPVGILTLELYLGSIGVSERVNILIHGFTFCPFMTVGSLLH